MRMAKLVWLASLVVVIAGVSEVAAIPTLQLYIEGATYDSSDETWVTPSPTFILWVIGDVQTFGTIYDVKLAAAVKSNETGSISLTSTTATASLFPPQFPNPDPSLPSQPKPTNNFPSPDGAIPQLTGGGNLPSHGIYGPGVKFFEWELGDFTLTDSPIGDFVGNFPTNFPKQGQINAYIVEISGFSWVHFDAHGHIVKPKPGKMPVFAPFSHDALYTPEPSASVLVVAGIAVLLVFRRRIAVK